MTQPAAAQVFTKKVTKTVTEDVKMVMLTMDMATAETLRWVVGYVAGDRNKSRRKHTEIVWDALVAGGVGPIKLPDGTFHMRFENEENLQ